MNSVTMNGRTMITSSSNVQSAAVSLPPQGDSNVSPAAAESPQGTAHALAASPEAAAEPAAPGTSPYPPLPAHAQALAAQAGEPAKTAVASAPTEAKGETAVATGTSTAAPAAGAAAVTAATEKGKERKMVEVDLPGLGKTYLDSEMATKVTAWIAAASEKGVELKFNSAYRDQEKQSSLKDDPKAITPADLSLHSAGLAVDVNYSSLKSVPKGLTGDEQRKIIRETAAEQGLKWGGDFTKKDPPHFYFEPAGDRQKLIDAAAGQVNDLKKSTAQ
jgi:D-alanyl-D-alanine dipeptidase